MEVILLSLQSNSRFSKAPVNNISRSIIDRPNTLVSSFSAGKLVPIYWDEVLPGDTSTMDMSFLCRMATPIFPVMDTAWIDVFFFFVPLRLVWENSRYFFGESKDAWDSEIEYRVPTDNVVPTLGNVYDYLGVYNDFVDSADDYIEVSALPRRAYQLIWNEWFRDQNLQDPLLIDKGDNGVDSGFGLLPVNRFHDYFSSSLPAPQKGASVNLPIYPRGATAPVVGDGAYHDLGSGYSFLYNDSRALSRSLMLANVYYGNGESIASLRPGSEVSYSEAVGGDLRSNLVADLDGLITSGTINDLRQAFAVQRLLERDARGGSRYRELVKAHFGVDVPDARVQVPEYLGGAHVPINIMQVVQQSSTGGEPSPLGDTGAVSKTVYSSNMFTKSFVEHGIILGCACVRTQHSYSQGVRRSFNRRTRLDYYWPELANIGEQAVMTKEIFAIGDGNGVDDDVFGYQEAWADYRYKPNEITGGMRIFQNATGNRRSNLAPWHYGDYYENVPRLSSEWLQETSENIARTLAVQDESLSDQFLFNAFFKERWARPMPVYSIPGLTGHF